MSEPIGIYTRYWRSWFSFAHRYHRYSVQNLEVLMREESCLVVGYHGRPVAYDMVLLLEEARRNGLPPHPIVHGLFDSNPMFRKFQEDMGMVSGDSDGLRAALDRGEHIYVTPGGTREGSRPSWVRYQVDWGHRRGYLKLALKYGLKIVPAGGWGADDCYVVPLDGYRLGKSINMPLRMPFFVGFGLGLWPMAMPLPVKLTTVLGEPIDLLADGPVDASDPDQLDRLHDTVVGAVQSILDRRPRRLSRRSR